MPNPSSTVHAAHPLQGLRAASAISEARAETVAAEHYGLEVTAHRLDSERDQNFRLTAPDGRDYVLKIANPAEERAMTNLQTGALLHLAAADPGLPIPRILPAQNGAHELAVAFDDDSTRMVRLLSYMDGIPMHAVKGSSGLRRDLGQCAARLAKALRNFWHARANHKLPWDLQHAAELSSLTDAVPADRRGLVDVCLGNFVARALPVLPQLHRQPVHNDLNLHNIVVDPVHHERISGIIDFGDLTLTARINDLAIAAAYQVADSDDPLAPACELIAAYHAAAPLDPIEFDILFTLMATRMAMTVAISSWRARRHPENRDHILRNNDAAWARLRRISRLSPLEAKWQIQRACAEEQRTWPQTIPSRHAN